MKITEKEKHSSIEHFLDTRIKTSVSHVISYYILEHPYKKMQAEFPTHMDKETQGHGLQSHLYLYNKKDSFNRHMRLKRYYLLQ